MSSDLPPTASAPAEPGDAAPPGPPPGLVTEALVTSLAGAALVRQARQAVAQGVAEVGPRTWDKAKARATVKLGGQPFPVRLDLTNARFPDNRCPCPAAREGAVCLHATLLLLAELPAGAVAPAAPPPRAVLGGKTLPVSAAAGATGSASAKAGPGANSPAASSPSPAGPPSPKCLQLSEAKGTPLRVWVLLPPNLAATAPRDQIAAKFELELLPPGRPPQRVAPEQLDRGHAYWLTPPHAAAAHLIEGWGAGRLFGLARLTRERLRHLLLALLGEPTVAWVNRASEPLVWQPNGSLPGVTDHLLPTAPPPAPKNSGAAASVAKGPRGLFAENRAEPEVAARRDLTPGTLDGSEQYLAIGLPGRDHPLYDTLLDLVKATGFALDAASRVYRLRDRHKTLNFLAQHGSELDRRFGLVRAPGMAARLARVHPAKLRAKGETNGGQLAVELALEAGGASESELRAALDSGKHYVETPSGVYLLDPAVVARLHRAQQALTGDSFRPLAPTVRTRVSPAALTDTLAIVEEAVGEGALIAPDEWRRRAGALRTLGALPPAPMPPILAAQLRPYQQLGAAWLWHLHHARLGGVLADEMGLGKTVQAIAYLAALRPREHLRQPALVACPASLLENWRRELARFAPSLRVFVHHSSQRLASPEAATAWDVVITSYGTVARDADLFRPIRWAAVLADEAQHLKNRRTQHARALRALSATGRFVLTGTPIENSLDDLRSLFDFILPGYLAKIPDGARGEDRTWYDQRHRAQAAPYILRRAKTLVAPELPPKIEQTVYVELGATQRRLYQQVLEDTQRAILNLELSGANEGTVHLAALTQLLRLRQVCAEPRLLDNRLAPSDSAKLEALDEILEEAADGGHRVLVFSQFTSVLQGLRDWLAAQDIACCYLDGSTPPAQRQAEADRFQNDPAVLVFLISVKAGGTGLNLTAADTVVHFDPWWNPAVEAQATDRAHRLGQTKVVTSYKLIASETVEEKVLALQATKATLLRDLLDESAAATAKVSLADLRELIA